MKRPLAFVVIGLSGLTAMVAGAALWTASSMHNQISSLSTGEGIALLNLRRSSEAYVDSQSNLATRMNADAWEDWLVEVRKSRELFLADLQYYTTSTAAQGVAPRSAVSEIAKALLVHDREFEAALQLKGLASVLAVQDYVRADGNHISFSMAALMDEHAATLDRRRMEGLEQVERWELALHLASFATAIAVISLLAAAARH